MNRDSGQQKIRRALGRGLTNLIPQENDDDGSGDDVVRIDVNAIRPNPFQPRVVFAQEEIDGLTESIRTQGLLQPLVVRKKVDGYELVSGERRLRALRQIGWDKIPCIVKPRVSDREMLELALVENIQRENLNDMELANGYQSLITDCGISQEELSTRVGKSRSMVANTIRLLRLPSAVQDMVREGAISAGHARALLAIPDQARQTELARRIVSEGLTVRDIEAEVQKESPEFKKKKIKNRKIDASAISDPNMVQVFEKLQYKYGTSLALRRQGKGGRIELRFHDESDLTRILDLLL